MTGNVVQMPKYVAPRLSGQNISTIRGLSGLVSLCSEIWQRGESSDAKTKKTTNLPPVWIHLDSYCPEGQTQAVCPLPEPGLVETIPETAGEE